jgi:hypothetical protein
VRVGETTTSEDVDTVCSDERDFSPEDCKVKLSSRGEVEPCEKSVNVIFSIAGVDLGEAMVV